MDNAGISPSLVFNKLSRRYGRELQTQLKHSNLTTLFVAALLSPQCTDRQVNKTTEELFKKFKTFEDYSKADLGTLKRYLKGINYYKTKARNLKAASVLVVKKFHGKVPNNMKDLMELQGVGRKVANVILNEGYGINEGIAVDTHVSVTARRLGLAKSKDPYKIEQDIMRAFEKNRWGRVSNLLIALGRDTCKARNKECFRCVLRHMCLSSDAK